MDYSDLHNKSKEELVSMRKELNAKLMKLSFDLAANRLKDSSQLNKTKKDIARILTALQLKST